MLNKNLQKEIRNRKFEQIEDGSLYLPQAKVTIGGVFTHWVNGGEKLSDHNIVVNQGLNHLLDVTLSNAAQNATWYVGIFKANYTPLSTDTAANIAANSTESSDYTESVRQTWVEPGVGAQLITNAASPAAFTINATITAYGAFLISDSTKQGTSGTLMAASKFATSRALVNTDVLNITYALSVADA